MFHTACVCRETILRGDSGLPGWRLPVWITRSVPGLRANGVPTAAEPIADPRALQAEGARSRGHGRERNDGRTSQTRQRLHWRPARGQRQSIPMTLANHCMASPVQKQTC